MSMVYCLCPDRLCSNKWTCTFLRHLHSLKCIIHPAAIIGAKRVNNHDAMLHLPGAHFTMCGQLACVYQCQRQGLNWQPFNYWSCALSGTNN